MKAGLREFPLEKPTEHHRRGETSLWSSSQTGSRRATFLRKAASSFTAINRIPKQRRSLFVQRKCDGQVLKEQSFVVAVETVQKCFFRKRFPLHCVDKTTAYLHNKREISFRRGTFNVTRA